MPINQTHPWTEASFERRILAHAQLPIHSEVVALRNDLRDAAKEVRRLMDENAKLRIDLAEQWRPKEGKP